MTTAASSSGQHPSGLAWMQSDADLSPQDLLVAMLSGAEPSSLLTHDFEGEPGTIEPHCHTEDIVAFIISGRIAFDVGPGFGDRLEFGPGDCIYLPAMLPHGEEVLGNAKVVAKVASLLPFETELV